MRKSTVSATDMAPEPEEPAQSLEGHPELPVCLEVKEKHGQCPDMPLFYAIVAM